MSFPNPYGHYSAAGDVYGSNPPTPHQQQDASTPAFPQWETIDQQHLEQQPLHSPLETTPIPTPTSGHFHMQLEVEDPPHMVVPSHHSPVDDAPILLRHPHDPLPPQPQRRSTSGSSSTAMHPVDALLFRPPGSGPSTPGGTSASSSSTAKPGVVRTATSSRGRATATHPYYRAPVGTSSGVGASFMTPSAVTTRSQARKQGVRFTGTAPHGGMVPRPTTRASGVQSSGMESPTTRVGFFGGSTTNSPQTQQHHSFSPQDPSNTPETPVVHQFPSYSPQMEARSEAQTPARAVVPPASRVRRGHSTIPSDMHYSDTDNTLTASMELPGVVPENLRVTLGTCYFNHVKYVGVTAENLAPFGPPEWSPEVLQAVKAEIEKGLAGAAAAGGEKLKVGKIVNPNMRERRFGIMRRLIQVPGHTTMEDIAASLKNGVLTLRIYCGKPFEQDDEQDVPVQLE